MFAPSFVAGAYQNANQVVEIEAYWTFTIVGGSTNPFGDDESVPMAINCTFKRLTVNIRVNTVDVTSTWGLNINDSTRGNLEFTVPSSTTGVFQDLVNTDVMFLGQIVTLTHHDDAATTGVIAPKSIMIEVVN